MWHRQVEKVSNEGDMLSRNVSHIYVMPSSRKWVHNRNMFLQRKSYNCDFGVYVSSR